MVHLNANGEKIILKTRCIIDNEVYIGPGVIAGQTEVNNHTKVEPGVKISWNARIGPNVSIEQDFIIGRNVMIEESAVIEKGAVTEDNVRIGARARILSIG
ncbi:hypothetical protein EAF00_010513 [Botryotinia globosa]|nr:hypothetical protein EAF00_010513 [Botryotinia globosa]